MSYFAGTIEALMNLYGSPKFKPAADGLKTAGLWFAIIDLGINIIMSAIENFQNNTYSNEEKWARFGFDVLGDAIEIGCSYLLGLTFSNIAVAGGMYLGGLAITYLGASLFTGIMISYLVTIGIIIIGAIIIYELSDWFEKWWKGKKEAKFS